MSLDGEGAEPPLGHLAALTPNVAQNTADKTNHTRQEKQPTLEIALACFCVASHRMPERHVCKLAQSADCCVLQKRCSWSEVQPPQYKTKPSCVRTDVQATYPLFMKAASVSSNENCSSPECATRFTAALSESTAGVIPHREIDCVLRVLTRLHGCLDTHVITPSDGYKKIITQCVFHNMKFSMRSGAFHSK